MSPTPDRAPSNRVGPADRARSTAKGDLPQAVLDRYLFERDRQGRPERFFRDHRAAEPLFRDRGRALVAQHAYPDTVADLLKIARHRGWAQLRVTGNPAFRREVWIQAQALGLEVQGHRPRERDRQAAGLDRPEPRSSHDRAPEAPDRTRLADRLTRAAVVVARLMPDPVARARLLDRARARAETWLVREARPGRERERRR